MKVAVRKLPIEDVAKLQMLVAENIDAIEPGLVVLDSRLLLGHATIDVVGLDANGALVLIATGLTANEEMLLKAVETYSWCREYPQSLERLYPSCVISEERPPRLLFVVERVPDAFHRKIKQLGFPEVDCVEFRLLDVDGMPAVYFDTILKLRRPAAPAPAAAAAPAPGVPRAETPVPEERPSAPENVIAMNGAAAARATSLKLQKLLNQAVADGPLSGPRASDRTTTPREPASVVSMVTRQATVTAPRAARVPLRQPEPMLAPEPMILTPEPVIVAPGPTVITPEPVVMPVAEPLIVAPAPTIVRTAPVIAVPEPVLATPEPIVTAVPEPTIEIAPQPTLAAIATLALEPEAEPELVLLTPETPAEPVLDEEPVLTIAPDAALVAQMETAIAALDAKSATPTPVPVSKSSAEIPTLSAPGTNAVPSMKSEPPARISLSSLPELSLRPTAPVAEAPMATAAEEPRVSFKDLASALLGSTATADAVAPLAVEPVAIAPVVETPMVDMPVIERPVVEMPVVEMPVVEAAAIEAPTESSAPPVVEEPQTPAASDALAQLIEAAVVEAEPVLTVESLLKNPQPAAAAPAVPATASANGAAKAALPQEFAGLTFPNDGVLTRQWMEFLSQMSTTK
jgi:hypothetical protein